MTFNDRAKDKMSETACGKAYNISISFCYPIPWNIFDKLLIWKTFIGIIYITFKMKMKHNITYFNFFFTPIKSTLKFLLKEEKFFDKT